MSVLCCSHPRSDLVVEISSAQLHSLGQHEPTCSKFERGGKQLKFERGGKQFKFGQGSKILARTKNLNSSTEK